MDKYLIVGLGNPGYEYENTRHNTGFMVLDKMAESVGVSFEDKRYGYVAETSIKGRKVFLLKPTTYMGIGSDFQRGQQVDRVLGKYTDEDMRTLQPSIDEAVEIIRSFVLAGLDITMNQFNKLGKKSKK